MREMDIDTAVDEPSAARDRFGFPIDPSVGYARGQILDGPVADMKRLTRAVSYTHLTLPTSDLV